MTCDRPRALAWRVCAALAALAAATPAHAQEESPTRLSVTVGPELDTNAQRQEGQEATRDGLLRGFLKLEHQEPAGQAQQLSLKALAGGKLYRDTRQEDALLTQADVQYSLWPLASWEQRWWFVTARASFKDQTERGHQRDTLRAQGDAGLGLRLGPATLSAHAGYGAFHFKPTPELSNRGPTWDGGLSLSWDDAWVLQANLSRSRKDYQVPRFVERGGAQIALDLAHDRQDAAWAASAGLHYRGPWLGSASVSWLDNTSNSYGQGLVRYGAALSAAVPLPWEVLLNGRVSLLRTAFEDPIFLLDDTLSVDEENRNSFLLAIERPLRDEVSLSAQYSLYLQEFGAEDADYGRHLFFLGLTLDL
jgi:hypothetical protein